MSFSERQSRTRFVPDAALPQQKERDAALADRPCPTVHVSILSHPNVLWCPDYYFSGAFFSGLGWGCFFWGSHAALQTGSDLWPRYAVLSTYVPWCPRLSAPVRICPSLPWVAMPRGLCADALLGGLSDSANSRRCRPAHGWGCLFWGSHAWGFSVERLSVSVSPCRSGYWIGGSECGY